MKKQLETPIIILAGGLGTRLQSCVPDTPKLLAPLGSSNFLNILLAWLEQQNATRVTFSLGYRSEQIITSLREIKHTYSFEIDWIIEQSPLGTLGGLSNTLHGRDYQQCLVLNGDTFIDLNLFEFNEVMTSLSSFCGIAAKHVDNTTQYGRLELKPNGFLSGFEEKNPDKTEPGWVNSGVYYLSSTAISIIKSHSIGDIEKSFFYNYINELRYYKITQGIFIDIGTPVSYNSASQILKDYIL